MAFGLALPTGCASDGEYLDLRFNEDLLDGKFMTTAGEAISLVELPAVLTPELPVGIDVVLAAEMNSGGMSLQQAVTCCDWWVELRDMKDVDATRLVESIMGATELPVERIRKGRTVEVDVRPGIRAAKVATSTAGGAALEMLLEAQPKSVNPVQVLNAVAPDQLFGEVRRVHQWIERDGARWEPLSADATDAPHTVECAT